MNNQPISIAFVIDTIATETAGTEKQLMLLLKHLDRQKFRPHLICLRNSEWLKTCRADFPIEIIGLKKLLSISALSSFRRFKSYIKSNDIKLVQTFFQDANLFGTLAAFYSRVPVIVSSRRNVGKGYWHTNLWLLLLRILKVVTTFYVANSRYAADYTAKIEAVDASKIHVVYNGMEPEKYTAITPEYRRQCRNDFGVTDDCVLIGIVANFRKVKNLALFVDMAGRIHAKYPHTAFVMVGDGEQRGLLERGVRECGLEQSLTMAGQLTDTLPILAALDIACLTSVSESLSNSILEYMAAALPAVVSDVGGNPEALGYSNGLVFACGDIVDFCEKIEKLIVDPPLRQELGCLAREYAERKYHWRSFVQGHEKLYEIYLKRL